jgi:hypothetical protein
VIEKNVYGTELTITSFSKGDMNSMSVKNIIKSGSAQKLLRVTVMAAVMSLVMFIISVAPASAGGATQISGFADLSGAGCDGGFGDFAMGLSGDLVGCNYVTIQSSVCSPSGTYNEIGTEYYVIVDENMNEIGTFSTTYRFTAKYTECDQETGIPGGVEIFGRCQHPIVAGSGTGVFEGVSGRLDYKDFPAIDEYPYRGHLRW